jgi:hypothetical protein
VPKTSLRDYARTFTGPQPVYTGHDDGLRTLPRAEPKTSRMEVTLPPLQQTAPELGFVASIQPLIDEQKRRINVAMDTAARIDVIAWLVNHGYSVRTSAEATRDTQRWVDELTARDRLTLRAERQRDHARQKLGTVEARLHEARQKLDAIAELMDPARTLAALGVDRDDRSPVDAELVARVAAYQAERTAAIRAILGTATPETEAAAERVVEALKAAEEVDMVFDVVRDDGLFLSGPSYESARTFAEKAAAQGVAYTWTERPA